MNPEWKGVEILMSSIHFLLNFVNLGHVIFKLFSLEMNGPEGGINALTLKASMFCFCCAGFVYVVYGIYSNVDTKHVNKVFPLKLLCNLKKENSFTLQMC